MTYPTHFLLAYGGTLMDGAEIWSNSIRFWDDTLADLSALVIDEQSALEHARGNLETLITSLSGAWANSTALTWIKFNKIGPDGRYASDTESNTMWLDGTAQIKGTNSTNILPPQCSIAVSLLTDRSRGLASRGRIFHPQPSVALDGTSGKQGTLGDPNRAAFAETYRAFLAGLGNWPGVDLTGFAPAVVSGVREGAAALVTDVSVGSIIDTQRRRRNDLLEERTNLAL